jgi:hypothetical protein
MPCSNKPSGLQLAQFGPGLPSCLAATSCSGSVGECAGAQVPSLFILKSAHLVHQSAAVGWQSALPLYRRRPAAVSRRGGEHQSIRAIREADTPQQPDAASLAPSVTWRYVRQTSRGVPSESCFCLVLAKYGVVQSAGLASPDEMPPR